MKRSIFKSPFVSGATSCFLALAGDMLWIGSSILDGMIKGLPLIHINILILALFVLSFLFMVYSVYRYIHNGYITKECADEIAYRKVCIEKRKRNKIFGNQHVIR